MHILSIDLFYKSSISLTHLVRSSGPRCHLLRANATQLATLYHRSSPDLDQHPNSTDQIRTIQTTLPYIHHTTMSFSTAFASEPTQWDEDKATLSNYQEVKTDHIDLDWSIDWKKQVIHGGAQLRMTATKDIKTVVLDSSYLDIKKVSVDGAEVKWSHGERIGAMGEGLKIELKDEFKKGQVSFF